jgi:hypothetical protein
VYIGNAANRMAGARAATVTGSCAALGARHVGIVYDLLGTGRPHNVNPYDFSVDVLQRFGQHPGAVPITTESFIVGMENSVTIKLSFR